MKGMEGAVTGFIILAWFSTEESLKRNNDGSLNRGRSWSGSQSLTASARKRRMRPTPFDVPFKAGAFGYLLSEVASEDGSARWQQVKASRAEDRMSETYNRKQAMERLGILSTNSFLFLQRKHPDAFVIVNQGMTADKNPLYDKDTLDDFARRREHFEQSTKGERP